YAKKVRDNPELSVTYDEYERIQNNVVEDNGEQKATKRQIAASFILLIAFGVLIYGLLVHGWYFRELAGLYILTGVAVGIVGGLNGTQIAESFVEGFKNIILGALVVGIARGIAVVLNDGNIMDTLIYAAGNVVAS